MKLVTRDTDYAIRALCCISKEEEDIVSVKQLVKCLKMPRPFLRKLLQTLTKKRLLKSHKGKGGGFELKIPLSELSLLRLMEIFQGPMKISDHKFKKEICPNIKHCPLKRELDCIEDDVLSRLKHITIGSLSEES